MLDLRQRFSGRMSDPEATSSPILKKHVRPNVSRLEPVRQEIAEARRSHWPYRKIIDYLRSEHEITIALRNLRLFCIRRGIEKGVGETAAISEEIGPPPLTKREPKRNLVPHVAKRRKPSGFVYTEEDAGPMKTRANGLIKD